ncbi:MAG: hypothetical protein HY077_16575 [Elusimicrobia bacterium]|nr:hypothetical protein [Elusimicrobiota bacterium]
MHPPLVRRERPLSLLRPSLLAAILCVWPAPGARAAASADSADALLGILSSVKTPDARLMGLAELDSACLAYASGQSGLCGRLKAFPIRLEYGKAEKKSLARPQAYDFLCLSDYYDLSFSRAKSAGDGPGMREACRGHEEMGHANFRAGTVDEACAVMSEPSTDPETACRMLEPYFARRSSFELCPKEMRLLAGDADLCKDLGGEPTAQEVCEANAAFRTASLLREPARCGDSALCRAAMGAGPQACAPYAQKARMLACRLEGRGRCGGPAALDAALVRQVDERILAAQAFVGRLSAGKPCESSLSFEALLQDYKNGFNGALADELSAAVEPDLERYSLCRAYAQGGAQSCGELKALRGFITREEGVPAITLELLCETLYYEAAIAKAMVTRSSQTASLCVTRNVIGDRDFKLDSLERSCAIVAGFSGSTTTTCGALSPFFDNASIAKTCPKMLRFVTGDETVCPELPDAMVHERCLGYAAFAKAVRGRDPALCGASRYCAVLMGGGARTCQGYEGELRRNACAFFSRADLPGKVSAVLRDARGKLGRARDSEGSAEGFMSADFARREEILSALEKSIERLAGRAR